MPTCTATPTIGAIACNNDLTMPGLATPVNWKPGDDVIIPPAVSNEQAAAKYPNGWKTLRPYLRVVAQPGN